MTANVTTAWEKHACSACRGTGDSWSLDEGGYRPGDCAHCYDGAFYVHRESGSIAAYPGGPFLGRVATTIEENTNAR